LLNKTTGSIDTHKLHVTKIDTTIIRETLRSGWK